MLSNLTPVALLNCRLNTEIICGTLSHPNYFNSLVSVTFYASGLTIEAIACNYATDTSTSSFYYRPRLLSFLVSIDTFYVTG